MNIAKKDFEQIIEFLGKHNETLQQYQALCHLFPEKQDNVIDEVSVAITEALEEAEEDLELVHYLSDVKQSQKLALFSFLKTARRDWRVNHKYKGSVSLEMFLQLAKFSFGIGPRPIVEDTSTDTGFNVCETRHPIAPDVLDEVKESLKCAPSHSEFF